MIILEYILGWFLRLFVLMSQIGNALLLYGNPDETISARCYRNKDNPYWGKAYLGVNKVFFWEENHCYESHLKDQHFAKELIKK